MFIILVSEHLKLFFILKDQQFMNGTAPNLADRKELQGVVKMKHEWEQRSYTRQEKKQNLLKFLPSI